MVLCICVYVCVSVCLSVCLSVNVCIYLRVCILSCVCACVTFAPCSHPLQQSKHVKSEVDQGKQAHAFNQYISQGLGFARELPDTRPQL